MDLAIKQVTPEYWMGRGAEAFDAGVKITDHDLNYNVAALNDWMRGYRLQQLKRQKEALAQARTEVVRQVARQQLAEVSPP